MAHWAHRARVVPGFPMFSRFFWRPLAGAALLALPALALLPGCGGGGSGSGSGLVYYKTGLNFLDGATSVTSGNLSVTYNPNTLATQPVYGYVEILGPMAGTMTSAAVTGTVKTRALPDAFIPAPATYQVTGTASLSQINGTPTVNLRGAFVPQRTFVISGPFNVGQTLTLSSTYSPTDAAPTTGTLALQVLKAPIVLSATPTPTPVPTTTGTPKP